MFKKTRKVFKWIMLLFIIIFLLVWVGSLLKNYTITKIYSEDLKNLKLYESEVAPEYDYNRITYYSKSTIKVYFVKKYDNYEIGGIGTYRCNGLGDWFYQERVMWSTAGTADTLIWPYWHHIFYYIND